MGTVLGAPSPPLLLHFCHPVQLYYRVNHDLADLCLVDFDLGSFAVFLLLLWQKLQNSWTQESTKFSLLQL